MVPSGSENIIAQILDLAHLCHGQEDVKKVLDLLVEKVAGIMNVDVCSLYLLDSSSRELVLKATKGLHFEAIDKVRLKCNEGLVGKTFELLKPVSVAKGSQSKNFKYVPGIGEERFASFLSVPLIHNRQAIGVLVIQNEKPVKFSPQSIHLFMTLAIPVLVVIEKAKLLGTFDRISVHSMKMKRPEEVAKGQVIEGVPASPGIGIGRVKIIHRYKEAPKTLPLMEPIHADVEKMRLLEAFRWVEEEITHVQKKASEKFGMEELSIFDAYKMVLESQPFKDQILQAIDEGYSALQSVDFVIKRDTEELARAEDEYIRERVYDIQDIGRKIKDRLLYGDELPHANLSGLQERAILFCDGWSISDFVELDLDKTIGLLSTKGGASSHIAILAQSLGIPTVLGLASLAEVVQDDQKIIMDGTSGKVILDPDPQVYRAYKKEDEQHEREMARFLRDAKKSVFLKGGKKVTIGVNMGIVPPAKKGVGQEVDEVGLYRSEFPFLMSRSLPTEQEQFDYYQRILKCMGKKPVTIRTLDIGGDKYPQYLNLPREENPALGWRSIRFSLDREDLFRIQLRALYRASSFGQLRILFPLISSVDEIYRIKEVVKDVQAELKAEKVKFVSKVPLGMMIEVPSAVELIHEIMPLVSFVSVGTNDLIQYLLAVDRNNSRVAHLYQMLHPAVIRSLSKIAKASQKWKTSVSVCGDMAGNPLSVLLLLGMGVYSLSMSAPRIPLIKSFIKRLNKDDLPKLLRKSLRLSSTTQIDSLLRNYIQDQHLEEYLPHTVDVV